MKGCLLALQKEPNWVERKDYQLALLKERHWVPQ